MFMGRCSSTLDEVEVNAILDSCHKLYCPRLLVNAPTPVAFRMRERSEKKAEDCGGW
jgi:hypothetical protein